MSRTCKVEVGSSNPPAGQYLKLLESEFKNRLNMMFKVRISAARLAQLVRALGSWAQLVRAVEG